MEQWIERKEIFRGNIVSLVSGTVRLEDGQVAPREVVRHGGGVGVVPLADGAVLLVRQYRIAVEDYVLEIPAGRLEGREDPIHRAERELEEETGYRARQLIHVASCYCSPGFTNEIDHIFLALDLEKTEQKLEWDERVEIVPVPLNEVEQRLAGLEFRDAKTIIGLRELLRYLEQERRDV